MCRKCERFLWLDLILTELSEQLVSLRVNVVGIEASSRLRHGLMMRQRVELLLRESSSIQVLRTVKHVRSVL